MSTRPRPPVTVLCGFLGAGKTTLLNHLLAQAEGRRWAAVVNDVAAINIDAAVVRKEARGEVVELGNGCVCCTGRDDLAEAVAQLAGAGAYDHILVETSGVAEPRAVANLFVRENQFGRSLGDFARLSALVSVIDVAYFLEEWRTSLQPELPAGVNVDGKRPLMELMLEQVECADVIVLNKCDRAPVESQDQLEAMLRELNRRAEIVRTERGQVASEFLLGRVRFDPKETLGAAEWLKVLNGVADERADAAASRRRAVRAAPPHTERFGIKTFVYQRRRPFAQDRFRAWLDTGLPGLLRAKGFFWIAERPDELGFLSVAGGMTTLDFPSYWWASLIDRGRARRTDVPAALQKLWSEPQGDRRQELVFIGVGLDENQIRQQLDQCLVP